MKYLISSPWNLFETKIVSNGAVNPFKNLLYSSPENKFSITGELTAPWVKFLFILYYKIFVKYYRTPCTCYYSCGSLLSTFGAETSVTLQWCKEDRKWTQDKYKDSLVSENGPKTNTIVYSRILRRLRILKISSKIRRFSKENGKL